MAAMPVIPIPAPQPEPLSQGARIVDTFIAPSKTFTDLRRSAGWWAPFLLLAVVAVLFAYSVDSKVGFGQAVTNQISRSPKASQRMEEMPADLRAQQMHRQAVGAKYFMYAFPLVTLVLYAIFAGIYLGIFKFGANADLTFGRAFAVVVYASLPEIFRGLLAIITLFAGVAPDSFNLQNPVATNLGAFLDPASSPFLYGIASSLDIFRIWSVVLTGIGFAYAGKVKQSTALVIVFSVFIFITLVFSGLGAMAS